MTMRNSVSTLLLTLVLASFGGLWPSAAQEANEFLADPATRLALDSIHRDLIELRFEEALAGVEALLGSNQLSANDRAEALVLRAQGHVAFGDLTAADEDYRQILGLRPGFVPDPSMTPRKVMDRFAKVQNSIIGRLTLRLFPGDATITVDGRPVTPSPDGELPLVAGEHLLRATAEGFDPGTQTVFVAAGRSAALDLRLRPNARSVLILTEPEDVDVRLDGNWVGKTERDWSESLGVGREPASLLLKNLSLGEHTFELSKDCHRSERRTDFLDVDLMNVAPKRYDAIHLVPVRSTLGTRGGPDGARVFVDGKEVGRLPLEPLELCPGTHDLEVRRGDRRVWTGSQEFQEVQFTVVTVEARPNVMLVGAEEWPTELARYRSRINEIAGWQRLPRGAPSDNRTWDRADLPGEVDLVLARRVSGHEGGPVEWFVYSPILELVAPLDLVRANLDRPRWTVAVWGFDTVDSEVGGPVRVVAVSLGGPAASAGLVAGDRITAVGGASVTSTRQLRRILAVASWKAPLEIEWNSADGGSRKKSLSGFPSIWLDPGSASEAPVRAAWALAEALGEGEWAETARANLAMLYSEYDLHDAAARNWRMVGWDERAGIGRGTAQYYLGRELEHLGQEAEAIQAYLAAARSSATAVNDYGPRIAPAARDRLADLGVSPD